MRQRDQRRPGASSAGGGLVLLLWGAATLTACGGGDGNAADAAVTAQAAQTERVQALAAGPAPLDSEVSARPIDTATLFDWAQVQLPTLFPAGATNQQLVVGSTTYTIRYYPGTDNYLGVAGGLVYGYGAFTGYQLQGFGFTADYTCAAAPKNCQARTGVALAWDGAGKAWNGSDWQ